MKKAAIYMRVSTARQEEEQTVENQRIELEKRIKADGNLLVPNCTYQDEGWSGAILERPALDSMRADAHEKKFEVLYAYDRGRVSRKFLHQEIILEELRKLGIEFISLHDINGDTHEEQLAGGIMGLFAEYERTKITERMRIGIYRKVHENKKLLGYQPKYGYDYHPRIKSGIDARDGYFSINIKQAEVVKQIFEWIADGVSKHEVRRKLFELGISPPKGKRDQWSGGTLDRMVRDTTYIGEHYYNKSESVPTTNPQNPEQKYRKIIKGSRKRRPKEDWYQIEVPAIVSSELFAKVQKRLEINKRMNTRNNRKHDYLLSGLVYCVCEKARTGDPANKGNRYYRCTDRLSKFPLERTCYEHGVNAPVLDITVWDSIKEMLTNPQLVRHQAERWQENASPIEKEIQTLRTRLTSLDNEERRYTKAYGQGVMSERLYKDNAQEVNDKRVQILSAISGFELELANKPVIPVDKLVDGVVKLVGNLDFTDKKFVIRKLVTKVVATKQEVTIWGQLPIPVTEQVGLHAEYRDCRAAECRQVYPI